MILAEELKLRNLVCVEHLGKKVKGTVEWIQKESISVRFLEPQDLVNGVVTSENKLIPIALSKTIMEKFGFMYFTIEPDCTDPADAYWTHKGMNIIINNLSWAVHTTGTSIKYLHQLQNLCWCLYEKELHETNTSKVD